MRRLHFAKLAPLAAAALLACSFSDMDPEDLAALLGLRALPDSVVIVETYEVAWTDYYCEWLIELDPADADELLRGAPFHPAAVESRAGTYGEHLPPRRVTARKRGGEVWFEANDGHCARYSNGRTCVWRSADRKRASIDFAGD